MMLSNESSLRPSLRGLAALAVFACASSLSGMAQQAAPAATQLVANNTVPELKLPSLASTAGVDYSSSSSSIDGVSPVASEQLNLSSFDGDGMQPPPRRRYGRPRYNDSSHNPDGSNKYAFVVGAGFTGPVGNTYHYLNTGYAFQVGGGRNFNKNFGVIMQFDYDHFGFNGRTLYNQQALYNQGQAPGSTYYLPSIDGNSHIWSFSLNPVYNIYQNEGLGAYVVGGVGFYHKVANFTTPVNTYACDYYYGCYPYTANEVFDHYTSNAPGFNGGLGLTFKPSRFAGERLFVEGRYVYIVNSQRYGYTVSNVLTSHYSGYDYYPANSNRTSYTAFKAGIRF